MPLVVGQQVVIKTESDGRPRFPWSETGGAVRAVCAAVALGGMLAAQQTDWIRARQAPRHVGAAMVYDSARSRMVLFGGADSSLVPLDDTWEWDGSAWLRPAPTSAPSHRYYHAMAYDSARSRVLLFGGKTFGGALLNDTWEWDGRDWLAHPVPSPTARSGQAMAYDVARRRVVLFGGSQQGTFLQDTWEWDGSQWSQAMPGTSPPARAYHSMAYDSARSRVLLFGGLDQPQTELNDTWEWDGSIWLQRAPTSRPPKRYWHAMADDSVRGRVVLFGGTGASITADTWEWDGSTWFERTNTTTPSARYIHAMAYDVARGRVVMAGGIGPSTGGLFGPWLSDTWEWDGSAWNKRVASRGPSEPQGYQMVYDSGRAQVVAFGGVQSFTGAYLNETWEWDGRDWVQRSSPTNPPKRRDHALAYDALRGRTVMFGGTRLFVGCAADTWEWDGSSWLEIQPTASPSPRKYHAMAYDAARGRVVLFGGTCSGSNGLADTWEWDGTAWKQRIPTSSPPARYGHSMAYDSARGRVVLFGGSPTFCSYYGDTWEWDGATWAQQSVAGAPSDRADHGMTYDAVRRRVVLFGGIGTSGQVFVDTWEWDGQSWFPFGATASSPTPRYGPGMVYDGARDRVVLYGGATSIDYDTYLYGSVVAAAATLFGTGCAGGNGLPQITAPTPFLGNGAFKLDLISTLPLSPCAFGVSAGTQALSLGGGCTLYLQLPVVALATASNAAGFASLGVPIPGDPTLHGGIVYAQGFVLDPLGPFAGIALSGGLGLTLGD